MRKSSLRRVVTFHTIAGALPAEPVRGGGGLEGRLISVPRSLTSDCGLAWSAPPELRPVLERRLSEAGVETAGFHTLTL